MPKLDRPSTIPISGALGSTAKCITIHEVHTDAEDSDLGLVKWTYEGRIPAKGIASEIWKEAKEKKQLFKIESDTFGPSDCSWRVVLKADFSATEPLTHVELPIAIPAHRTILAAGSDFFRSKFDFDEGSAVTTPTMATTGVSSTRCDIKDFTEPCIRAVLEFIYTRRIDQHMPQLLDDKLQLIVASDFYQVSGMHEYVAPHVLQHIAFDNAIKILATGYRHRVMSDALAKGAGKYLKSKWMELALEKAFTGSLAVDGVGDLLKYAFEGNW
ncbi:hypothetical protein HK097_005525 [Rhizophlyctis rosea]|uniref:BTB domain-containing protein n=1 Tax=Rhizophlyctis rosea TaxID=64517 RepID=A0AAD5X5I2_9FUNG|nr:hypothetical protein HK097_005525 [Rhizophlyctis rosea]